MPDQPIPRERASHPSKHRSLEDDDQQPLVPVAAYAELRCVTNFSFQVGASHADELVDRAWWLGYRALAITDINTLAGVVRAHVHARTRAFKLLIGAEITMEDWPVPVVLWSSNRQSYGQLCRLLTMGRGRSKKGECRLRWRDLAAWSDGLLAGVPLAELLNHDDAASRLHQAADQFGDRLYGLADLHFGANDRLRLEQMVSLADDAGIPPVACGAALYHDRSRRHLHDVLTAVRLKRPIAELAGELQTNGERHLRPTEQIAELYADFPELISRTVEVADRCSFSLDELQYEYPREIAPDGLTLTQYLRRETQRGAAVRYPRGVPNKVRRQVDTELKLIAELKYEAFFLTVYDAVIFARSKGILCQGRGSAANSAVCFCLGITEIDPAESNLLFERFLSTARNEAPDIDVDFEHERREEVIQYLYRKYGRERTGIAAAVATYRPRSAVRDIGKALGLSLDAVDRLAKHVGRWKMEVRLAEAFEDAGLDPNGRFAHLFARLLNDLLGFPRHLSQHSGGMVLTNGRLDELVPIQPAAMEDRQIVQWDKDDLSAIGLLKVDVLALGMLTAVRRCFDLVNRHYRPNDPLKRPADIAHGDRATYQMIQKAETMGVFQIESRAQMSMLPRLRPKCYYDLVIEVALVRPGPIQGDMVHPYLRRRDGLEEVVYPSKEVEEVLGRTLGVPIFQEQAMALAVAAAGFTPEESDQFRRAIGAWRSTGRIDEFEQRLKSGLAAKGYTGEFADRLFKQIRGFGEYGFPESHASGFALIVYTSCWLKCHYPAAFLAALLNSQPMGFYKPSQLVAEARGAGVEVRGSDVNHSEWTCTLEPRRNAIVRQEANRRTTRDQCAVRLGFLMIKGMREEDAATIQATRSQRRFTDYADFCNRTRLPGETLRRLADAGAFGSLGMSRRQSSWAARPTGKPLPMTGVPAESMPDLPRMSQVAEVTADYRATGLSLRGHPMQFLREELTKRGVVPRSDLDRLPKGRQVRVAGLTLLRQQPGSAKGVVFVTIEDETGTTNLIFWPDVWARLHRVARVTGAMIADGELQRQNGVIHVVVARVECLDEQLAHIRNTSRDFR